MPERSVRRNASSSCTAIRFMSSRSRWSLGYAAAHDLGHDVDDPRGDEVLGAQALGDEHSPADEAAQHIAAALVRGEDPVGDEEGQGAGVVGHDAKADVGLLAAPVDAARGCRGRLEDRRDEVGVEDRLDALDLGEDPVEPGTGVDVLLRAAR